jgi:putative ABC transport system permease protein
MSIAIVLDACRCVARDGLRALRRKPGLTAMAVLTLAIGIGAATVTFAVVDRVLIEPLPYPDSHELVAVYHVAPGAEGQEWADSMLASASMLATYAEESRTFEHVGAWTAGLATITGDGSAEEVSRIAVGDGLLQALAVPALLGRSFGAEEFRPGAAPTIVLGYGFWQRRFGGDASVIGRTLIVNARPAEIIGVMPRGFRIADVDADLLLPMRFDRAQLQLEPFAYSGIARLKPGVSLGEANADVARMLPIWLRSWPAPPGTNASKYSDEWRIAPSLRPLKEDVVGHAGELLWLAMAAIAVVLLIACANVANLMLVRCASREHELAIRAVLGAGRRRLTTALVLEGVAIGVMGGALGIGFAALGRKPLLALAPANLPRLAEVALNAEIVTLSLAVSVLAGLVVGLVSSARLAPARLAEGLHAGGRTSSETRAQRRIQRALVVGQVALAVVVLVCAGLLVRTAVALRAVDPGFVGADQVQTLRISMRVGQVPDPLQVARRQQAIVEGLDSLPGVNAVGFASSVPMDDFNHLGATVEVEGRSAEPVARRLKNVSPGFFDAAGLALLAGRDLSWTDLYDDRSVVLVSENLAGELSASPAQALGKRIHVAGDGDDRWREIVGVVRDVREDGLRAPAPAIVYVPSLRQAAASQVGFVGGPVQVSRSVIIAVRSRLAGTDALLRGIQGAMRAVDADLPITSVRTLGDIYDESLARTTFAVVMLVVTACAALALGVVGLYGVLSYAVSLRRREIAIRLALGAGERSTRRRLVREGVALAGVGIAIGLVVAAGVTRLMVSLLYGVQPVDLPTYAAIAIGLALVAALASYLPARRASAVDPVAALAAD